MLIFACGVPSGRRLTGIPLTVIPGRRREPKDQVSIWCDATSSKVDKLTAMTAPVLPLTGNHERT